MFERTPFFGVLIGFFHFADLLTISSSSTFNTNFCEAVNIIHNTKGKIVITGVGKSAHIGNKISATLTSTGTPSYFIHATEASHGDLGSIKKDDCVIAISNSGETSELNNFIEFTKRFNISFTHVILLIVIEMNNFRWRIYSTKEKP